MNGDVAEGREVLRGQVLPRTQQEAAEAVLESLVHTYPADRVPQRPVLKAVGHERFSDGAPATAPAIWWEEGPEEWVYSDGLADVLAGSGWFVEPINGWSVGIYRA